MKANAGVVLLLVFLCPVATYGQTPAKDSLNTGIQAMESGEFAKAVEHFRKAIELDPGLTIAELHLGTAYRQQFILSDNSPENLKRAELLIQSYQNYLRKDPKNAVALVGVATVYQNTLQFDKAREAYIRCTEVLPQNHLPFYAVGTMDWLLVHNWGSRFSAKEKETFIEEGIRYLDKALVIEPAYKDTLWYQNLILREKVILLADRIKVTTDTPTRNALLAESDAVKARADEWAYKALEMRKKNFERSLASERNARD